MRSIKTHNLVVGVGKYEDKDGDTKTRWKNVGVAMRNEKGTFLLIDSTFNFAAVVDEPGGSVLVGMYDIDEDDDRGYIQETTKKDSVSTSGRVRKKKAAAKRERSFPEDIPF